MSAALAGALATAKAANPGAKTAAAHAREGQATTARSKKWIGAASRRSAQAALKLRSRQARGKSRQARGKSRPVEAPCAPLPPSGFEPVAFAARGKRLRHRAIHRSRFCWPANWRDISTWLVLHCSAHAEAATFGQLGLQLVALERAGPRPRWARARRARRYPWPEPHPRRRPQTCQHPPRPRAQRLPKEVLTRA